MPDLFDIDLQDRKRPGAPPPPPAPFRYTPPVDWNNSFVLCEADDWRATGREASIDGVKTTIGVGMPEAVLVNALGKKAVALTDSQIAVLGGHGIAVTPVGDGTKYDIADADIQLGQYFRPRLYNERRNP